jgi:cold shock protein
MAAGKVKWFNNAKGYGFILPESGGEDLFAHYSSIQMDGYKTLRAGQDVEFDILQGPKGMHAVNIRGMDEQMADAATANGSVANGEPAAPAYADAAGFNGGSSTTS